MLNLKKVNFAVIAILLGGTIAMTQSAFTTKALDPNYGKSIVGSTVKWVSLTNLTQKEPGSDLDQHQYACDINLSEVCKGYFASQPADNTPDPAIVANGDFRYNP